jgi:hypothetical protein
VVYYLIIKWSRREEVMKIEDCKVGMLVGCSVLGNPVARKNKVVYEIVNVTSKCVACKCVSAKDGMGVGLFYDKIFPTLLEKI